MGGAGWWRQICNVATEVVAATNGSLTLPGNDYEFAVLRLLIPLLSIHGFAHPDRLSDAGPFAR
jgi:hypothetical protein